MQWQCRKTIQVMAMQLLYMLFSTSFGVVVGKNKLQSLISAARSTNEQLVLKKHGGSAPGLHESLAEPQKNKIHIEQLQRSAIVSGKVLREASGFQFPIGSCQGVNGDDTVRIEVRSDNSRTLTDTTRPGFVQSMVRCVGKAPKPMHGSCDDEEVRAAWKCANADFSISTTPYFKAMVDPIVAQCHHEQSTTLSVLMLGLGGGIKPSYLKAKCKGINVTSVEKNPNVVTAARNFFAFTGDVVVNDMHVALKDLAREGRHFDAVVSDVGYRVVLGEEGMRNAFALLNPNGLVLEKLSESDLGPEQLKVFKSFLGDVAEIKLPWPDGRRASVILSGRKPNVQG